MLAQDAFLNLLLANQHNGDYQKYFSRVRRYCFQIYFWASVSTRRLWSCKSFPFNAHQIVIMMSCSQEKELKNAKFLIEIRAGLTTFFTMAYVIAVNVSLCTTSLKDAAH